MASRSWLTLFRIREAEGEQGDHHCRDRRNCDGNPTARPDWPATCAGQFVAAVF